MVISWRERLLFCSNGIFNGEDLSDKFEDWTKKKKINFDQQGFLKSHYGMDGHEPLFLCNLTLAHIVAWVGLMKTMTLWIIIIPKSHHIPLYSHRLFHRSHISHKYIPYRSQCYNSTNYMIICLYTNTIRHIWGLRKHDPFPVLDIDPFPVLDIAYF